MSSQLQLATETGNISESSSFPLASLALKESELQFEWTWDRTIKCIILIPIVLGTIIGNFLVLFAFVTKGRDLRSPTHFFIANLALADGLVGVLVLPFLATLNITDRWYFGQGMCEAWVIIHFWLCSSSILSTCAVAFERYIGVKFPLKHSSILSRSRIGWMCLFVWVLAGSLTLIPVYAWPEPPSTEKYVCKINQQIGHVIVATVGILYIPAIIMIVLYWRIFVIASKHFNNLKKKHEGGRVGFKSGNRGHSETSGTESTSGIGSSSIADDPSSNGLMKDVESAVETTDNGAKNKGKVGSSDDPARSSSTSKQIMLAKRLAILVGFLLITYVPFFTLFLIRALNPESIPFTVFIAFGWGRYFNSCANPVIYAFAVPGYKKAMETILGKAKLWN